MGYTTFDSTKTFLRDILQEINDGKLKLPDFQRGWIWDDEHIRGLLTSVSLSYPIGAVMLLQTGNPDVRFIPRLVEGVDISKDAVKPERLILDGQQRLTTLYQTLFMNQPVSTKNVKKVPIQRWYYLDMMKCLDTSADREDAIKAISTDKKVLNFQGKVELDYSTPDKEYEDHLFPVAKLFEPGQWRQGFNKYWSYNPEKANLFDQFENEVIERFKTYQLPLIVLGNTTPKEAVCQVFEKVNTGGVSLNVFELLTATFAADDFRLRDHWEEVQKQFKQYPQLKAVESSYFLQTVSLLTTFDRKQVDAAAAISCKRKDILDMNLEEYRKWEQPAVAGYIKAAKLLFAQKFFTARDIPYATQLVPLAALYSILGSEADADGARSKLLKWYWCGVFGELYGSAIETRFAKDVVEVIAWIKGGATPSTVEDANFASNRINTLRTRNSAAYKGIYALLMRDGGLDFRTGEPIDISSYFDDAIDIHHIFPVDYCLRTGIHSGLFNSVVNKTALSARTNRMIGGKDPNNYLSGLEKSAGIGTDRMNQILLSHMIDPQIIRSNDFTAFFEARKNGLLDKIEQATGKAIRRDEVVSIELPANDDEDEGENETAG